MKFYKELMLEADPRLETKFEGVSQDALAQIQANGLYVWPYRRYKGFIAIMIIGFTPFLIPLLIGKLYHSISEFVITELCLVLFWIAYIVVLFLGRFMRERYILNTDGITIILGKKRKVIPWKDIVQVDYALFDSGDHQKYGDHVIRCFTAAYAGQVTGYRKKSYYKQFRDDVIFFESGAKNRWYFEHFCPLPIRDFTRVTKKINISI